MSDAAAALVWEVSIRGDRYECTWLEDVEDPASRVRALAFPEPGRVLLVRGDDGLQIPGGGVEPGELSHEALRRELKEEADASILASQPMGGFRIEGLSRRLREVHAFYACRVRLSDEWEPSHDISERVVVDSGAFLDALPWGRSDPRAAFLLERALELEVALG